MLAGVLAGALVVLTGCSPTTGGAGRPSPADTATASSHRTRVPAAASTATPTPTSTATSVPTASPAAVVTIVAVGDSVTSGFNCHCTAFPALYARLLAIRDSIRTRAMNLGVPGLTTTTLLGDLTGTTTPERAIQDHVAGADIVVVTIGANDFFDEHDAITAGACSGARRTTCTRDDLTTMTRTISRIVDQIRTLRVGAPTTIMLTGYWNVFEDGDVADRAFSEEGVASSVALTKEANAGIRVDALAENAIYVDLYTVFEGADSDKDPTGLLALDGDHPDAAGHAAIARQLLADTPRS